MAGLESKDHELRSILESLPNEGDAYQVDFFGTLMSFNEFGHVLIEHEANHHGLWSMYAASAGFETPKSWRAWGL